MFEYYYHEILRKIVIGFGTLFNDVNIKTTDANNNVTNSVKVPLAYAPQQKFLARLEQAEDGIRDSSTSRGLGDVYKRQG